MNYFYNYCDLVCGLTKSQRVFFQAEFLLHVGDDNAGDFAVFELLQLGEGIGILLDGFSPFVAQFVKLTFRITF